VKNKIHIKTLIVTVFLTVFILGFCKALLDPFLKKQIDAFENQKINSLIQKFNIQPGKPPVKQSFKIRSAHYLGTTAPQPAYHIVNQGLLITTTAPDGYNGNITLLVAINIDQSIAGITVLDQHETPGLGDFFLETKSNWLSQFLNTSLSTLTLKQWTIRKESGHFDQWTGATITPKAIIQALANILLMLEKNPQIWNTESGETIDV
jgi:RnfABCDGE-type electron transport complex G subunit